MVTTVPMRKQISATEASRQPPPSFPPICSPMGIIAISAPREKKPIPTISIAAPSKKSIRVPVGMGARVKLRSSTMTVTGSTEVRDSEIFSFSFFCTAPPHPWVKAMVQSFDSLILKA